MEKQMKNVHILGSIRLTSVTQLDLDFDQRLDSPCTTPGYRHDGVKAKSQMNEAKIQDGIPCGFTISTLIRAG